LSVDSGSSLGLGPNDGVLPSFSRKRESSLGWRCLVAPPPPISRGSLCSGADIFIDVATVTAFIYNTPHFEAGGASAATLEAFNHHLRKLNMSSVEDRVRKIVVEQLGVKEDDVKLSSSFVDDLGADSLDTVELVMALEEEFETEIPDEEAEKITTVQLAVDYINAHS